MSPELQQKLFEKYPNQYREIKFIECRDGWYSIIDSCCATIDRYLSQLKKDGKDSNFFWSQQKSKFGGLRLYSYDADNYIRGAISVTENISYYICELSGDRGTLCIKNGWLSVMSEKTRIDNGYSIYEAK